MLGTMLSVLLELTRTNLDCNSMRYVLLLSLIEEETERFNQALTSKAGLPPLVSVKILGQTCDLIPGFQENIVWGH